VKVVVLWLEWMCFGSCHTECSLTKFEPLECDKKFSLLADCRTLQQDQSPETGCSKFVRSSGALPFVVKCTGKHSLYIKLFSVRSFTHLYCSDVVGWETGNARKSSILVILSSFWKISLFLDNTRETGKQLNKNWR